MNSLQLKNRYFITYISCVDNKTMSLDSYHSLGRKTSNAIYGIRALINVKDGVIRGDVDLSGTEKAEIEHIKIQDQGEIDKRFSSGESIGK